MHSTIGLFAIAIISLAVISQHDVFGASFYDQDYAFERRNEDALELAEEETIFLHAASDKELDELKKGITACMALPPISFQALLDKHFAENPFERRKRSADLMELFEDVARRSTRAERKKIEADLNELLGKMSNKELYVIIKRVRAAIEGGANKEKAFIKVVIDFVEKCDHAKKSRRLFALREFLESELMNEDN